MSDPIECWRQRDQAAIAQAIRRHDQAMTTLYRQSIETMIKADSIRKPEVLARLRQLQATGQQFPSLKEIARAIDVPSARLTKRYPAERAIAETMLDLTPKDDIVARLKSLRDQGRQFPTLQAIAKAIGVLSNRVEGNRQAWQVAQDLLRCEAQSWSPKVEAAIDELATTPTVKQLLADADIPKRLGMPVYLWRSKWFRSARRRVQARVKKVDRPQLVQLSPTLSASLLPRPTLCTCYRCERVTDVDWRLLRQRERYGKRQVTHGGYLCEGCLEEATSRQRSA